MRRRKTFGGWLALVLALLSFSCGKDEAVTGAPGSGGSSGAGGGSGVLRSCLDRPDELPRPPTGQLPCELIPPGLTLPGK